MDSSVTFFVYILLGSLGLGYFIYGKKQQNLTALISGICLMVLPYLVANIYILIPVAVLLLFAPKFIDF